VVACGSALYPAKGFDLWVEVCQATLRNAEFAGRFVWVGEEPRNLSGVAELVRGGQLLLTGVLDNPFPTLAAADIVVVPSRNEAFSRVVAEAMALGRPIVAFATGGIPEVLGDAGVLVEQGNIDAMAREVARLAGDADARRELGARAAHRADELNLLDDAQTRIRAVVKECLEDRPHHTMPIR
jgi:glycosyltransferase involved in cell wall biosynthesis